MKLIEIIAIISPLLALPLAMFIIMPWQIRRHMKKVVRILRLLNAADPPGAVTMPEMGIKERGFFTFTLLRDYKREALNGLVQLGAVKYLEEDGKYYLDERRFAETPFYFPPPELARNP